MQLSPGIDDEGHQEMTRETEAKTEAKTAKHLNQLPNLSELAWLRHHGLWGATLDSNDSKNHDHSDQSDNDNLGN